MKENRPQRKSIRLRNYDYSQPGFYFVTVCTAVRGEDILCSVVPNAPAAVCPVRPAGGGLHSPDGVRSQTVSPPPVGAAPLGGPPVPPIASSKTVLTAAGEIVEEYIQNMNWAYSGQIRVDCYTIMPDHIHLIIQIRDRKGGPPRAAAPTAALPAVINTLKGLSVKKIGYPIWQRGYHEHIIRSDSDLRETRLYIRNNPLKWLQDKE